MLAIRTRYGLFIDSRFAALFVSLAFTFTGGSVMLKQSALGCFAFACFLFAAMLFGMALAAANFPDLAMYIFWHPFALMVGILVCQGCSALLTIVATILGACSIQSACGRLAAIGGPVLFIANAAFLVWAFSLLDRQRLPGWDDDLEFRGWMDGFLQCEVETARRRPSVPSDGPT